MPLTQECCTHSTGAMRSLGPNPEEYIFLWNLGSRSRAQLVARACDPARAGSGCRSPGFRGLQLREGLACQLLPPAGHNATVSCLCCSWLKTLSHVRSAQSTQAQSGRLIKQRTRLV